MQWVLFIFSIIAFVLGMTSLSFGGLGGYTGLLIFAIFFTGGAIVEAIKLSADKIREKDRNTEKLPDNPQSKLPIS